MNHTTCIARKQWSIFFLLLDPNYILPTLLSYISYFPASEVVITSSSCPSALLSETIGIMVYSSPFLGQILLKPKCIEEITF